MQSCDRRHGVMVWLAGVASVSSLIFFSGDAAGQSQPGQSQSGQSQSGQSKPKVASSIVRQVSPSILQSVPSGDSRGWARFMWIGGRLHLDQPRHKRGTQELRDGERMERFTVTARDGVPSVHYVYQCPAHHWTLSFDQAQTLRIESWDRINGDRLIMIQKDNVPIRLTLHQGDQTTHTDAETWIHLYHQKNEVVRKHFEPLIDSLVPHHPIQFMVRQTESAIERAMEDHRIAMDDVTRWVNDLKHSRRSRRRDAQRQLLLAGTPVLPILESMDQSRWDEHQRAVIASVHRRLNPGREDRPKTLAHRFVNDRSYWQAWVTDKSRQKTVTVLVARHLDSLDVDRGDVMADADDVELAANMPTKR